MAAKKKAAAKKPPTKSEIYAQIADSTGLSRRDIGGVFDAMGTTMKKSLRGNGLFTVPGMFKVRVVRKPATKARKGINPFTGEPTVFKAKPARNVVKVLPLKSITRLRPDWHLGTVLQQDPT